MTAMEKQGMKWQVALSAFLLAVLIGSIFFPVFKMTGERYITSVVKVSIYAEKTDADAAKRAGTRKVIDSCRENTKSRKKQAKEFEQKIQKRTDRISGFRFIQWGLSAEKELIFPGIVYVSKSDMEKSGANKMSHIMAMLLLLPILLAMANLIFMLVRRKTYPVWLGVTGLVEILFQILFWKLAPGMIWIKLAAYIKSFPLINEETMQISGTGKYAVQSMVSEFMSTEFYMGIVVGTVLLLLSVLFMTVCRPSRIEIIEDKGGINMYCNQCGNKLSEGTVFCPACGKQVDRGSGIRQQHSLTPGIPRINTVFSGLLYEKNRGAYWEFGIWVAVCVLAVLSLLAGVLVDGDGEIRTDFRTFCIFLLICVIGYGILIMFRQRIWAICYSVVTFFFVLLIPYFHCEKQIYSVFLDTVDEDTPTSLWIIYVLALLTVIGLIVCLFVHIFSQFQLSKSVMILGIIMMAFIMMLGICTYAVPKHNYKAARREEFRERNRSDTYIIEHLDEESDEIDECYKEASNGLRTTVYVMICLVSGAYILFFFWGIIDNRKQKIDLGRLFYQGQQWQNGCDVNTGGYNQGGIISQSIANQEPAIQFISGVYAGRTIRIQGEVILGSAQGKAHIVLPENMISAQHCVIRFNRNTGNYEIRDLSKNGIYTQNGARLQRGVYLACARGTLLYLGGRSQKICLR